MNKISFWFLPKNSTNGHHEPEVDTCKVLEIDNGRNLTKYKHERHKQNTSIDIIVECKGPNIAVYDR